MHPVLLKIPKKTAKYDVIFAQQGVPKSGLRIIFIKHDAVYTLWSVVNIYESLCFYLNYDI